MSPSLLVLMARLTLVERPKFPETSPGSGSILLAGSTPHLSVGYPIWRDQWELAKTRPPMQSVSRPSRVLSMLGSRISQQ